MSQETRTTHSGNITETKTYENGRCTDIQHTNDRTQENHSHEVNHGLMGTSPGKQK